MANYQYPYQTQLSSMANQFNQFQQIQSMFPQPQGSVYSINSPVEIGNVPIGSTGLSVALCLGSNLMYIKSFQNGSPIIMTYHITPHDAEAKAETETTDLTEAQLEKLNQIDVLQDKLNKIEGALSQSGGKFNGLL